MPSGPQLACSLHQVAICVCQDCNLLQNDDVNSVHPIHREWYQCKTRLEAVNAFLANEREEEGSRNLSSRGSITNLRDTHTYTGSRRCLPPLLCSVSTCHQSVAHLCSLCPDFILKLQKNLIKSCSPFLSISFKMADADREPFVES